MTVIEFCEVCGKETVHEVQVTPNGEVTRCEECATVTAERI